MSKFRAMAAGLAAACFLTSMAGCTASYRTNPMNTTPNTFTRQGYNLPQQNRMTTPYTATPGTGYAGLTGYGTAATPRTGHTGLTGYGTTAMPGTLTGNGTLATPRTGHTGLTGYGTTAMPGTLTGNGTLATPRTGYTGTTGTGTVTTPGRFALKPVAFDVPRAERIVRNLGTIPGGRNVKAIVSGNTALVGYTPSGTAKNSVAAKYAIANRVKSMDKALSNVVVTNSAGLVRRIDKLSSDIKTKKVGSDLTGSFNELLHLVRGR